MVEERIVVVDLKKQCEECRQSCEEYDGFYADCSQCPFSEKSIKRTEAIERMAKAMSDTYFNDIHASEPDMLQALAEAALDALIKGE